MAPDRGNYLLFPAPLLASTAQERPGKDPNGEIAVRINRQGAIPGAMWFPSVR
jgi:hypothetical protein